MSSKTSERQRDKYFSHTEVPSVQRTSSWTISKGFWQAIHRRLGMDRKHKVSTSPVTRNANKAVTVFSPCSPQWVGKGCFRHRCSVTAFGTATAQHLLKLKTSHSFWFAAVPPTIYHVCTKTCATMCAQHCLQVTGVGPTTGPPSHLQLYLHVETREVPTTNFGQFDSTYTHTHRTLRPSAVLRRWAPCERSASAPVGGEDPSPGPGAAWKLPGDHQQRGPFLSPPESAAKKGPRSSAAGPPIRAPSLHLPHTATPPTHSRTPHTQPHTPWFQFQSPKVNNDM